MANTKITELTQLTNPVSTDVLPIVDVGADVTRKISIADLLKNAAVGTAEAPGIAFDGRSRNGIYSPGADQVAISTNGTGRLFVDASGNVGVNTNAPQYLLDVIGFGAQSIRVASADGDLAVLRMLSNGNNEWSLASDTVMRFRKDSTEYMRLDSSGRLGLGTSSPGCKVDIVAENNTSLAPTLRVNSNNVAVSTALAYDGLVGSGELFVRTSSPQKLHLGTNATNALIIDAAQQVGIGTTAPNRKLEVSDATVDNFIRIGTTGAFKSGIEFANGGTAFGQLYFNNVSPYDFSLLQQYSTGSVIFGTNNTERARIDSSGRLLVGTSSAETWFGSLAQIQAAGSEASFTAIRNQNTDSGAYLFLGKSRGTTANSTTIVQNNDQLGGIIFLAADGVNNRTQAASIYSYVDGTPGAGDMPSRLVFSTTADGASSPTERMRISSSGWVSLKAGTATVATAGNMLFQPDGNATNIPFTVNSGNSSSATDITYAVYSTSLSQYQFYVGYSGTVYARNTSISALSDQREKENIRPLETGLTEIMALQPRRFDWKNGSGADIAGFIAQEVEGVLPDLVDEYKINEEETRKALKMGDIIPTLVKAVQEQQAIISELQAKVAALEGV